jgi:TPM domain
MIRLTILLLTLAIAANAQDSVLVVETCQKINELQNHEDIMEQAKIISGQLMTYAPTIADMPKEKRVKALYTFQYKMHRELKRTCPSYRNEHAPKFARRVLDFEDKLSRPEIDSLTELCGALSNSKDIFVYIVTIDEYFPDANITDFSNRNREHWGQRGSYEKGNVVIVISTTQRQLRVSTSDVSMNFLTDEECAEVNKKIIPFFKEGKYFNGLISGLNEIEKSL